MFNPRLHSNSIDESMGVNQTVQRGHLPVFVLLFFCAIAYVPRAFAQESPSVPTSQHRASSAPTRASLAEPSSTSQKIILPAGTRLPLVLLNGVHTRTAKAGDSVYFETLYPIAQDGRIAIPTGSFVRGRLLEAKRPGRVKGRGEIRVQLDSLTLPNGYAVALSAIPNSADTGGKEAVDAEGKIKGPSGIGHDVRTVLAATAGGAYIGANIGLFGAGSPGKGAAIGAGAGAAGGLTAVLLTRGPDAELPRGTVLDVTFDQPLVLDTARLPLNDPERLSNPPGPTLRSQDERQQNRTIRRPGLVSLIRQLQF